MTFNGTGVWIYGAKRPNHAPYNITLDDQPYAQNDGHSDEDIFQDVLFSTTGLTNGPHTVSIADSVVDPSRQYLDIDWVRLGSVHSFPLVMGESVVSLPSR